MSSPLSARLFDWLNDRVIRHAAGWRRLSFVMEYPKCGASWLCAMLRNALGIRQVKRTEGLVARGDLLHLHELDAPHLWPAVVLVRDPRDVWVSFYHHERHVVPDPALFAACGFVDGAPDPENLFRYMRHKLAHPAESAPGFGYADFIESWAARRDACWVRYEDLHADPEAEVARILAFLGRPVPPDAVARAVRECAFERVAHRAAGDEDVRSHKRKGIVGDWRNYFDEPMEAWVNEHQGGLLRRLGCLPDTPWTGRPGPAPPVRGSSPSAPGTGS